MKLNIQKQLENNHCTERYSSGLKHSLRLGTRNIYSGTKTYLSHFHLKKMPKLFKFDKLPRVKADNCVYIL